MRRPVLILKIRLINKNASASTAASSSAATTIKAETAAARPTSTSDCSSSAGEEGDETSGVDDTYDVDDEADAAAATSAATEEDFEFVDGNGADDFTSAGSCRDAQHQQCQYSSGYYYCSRVAAAAGSVCATCLKAFCNRHFDEHISTEGLCTDLQSGGTKRKMVYVDLTGSSSD
jgi:hypothetical protein